jgi:hypothetical protein
MASSNDFNTFGHRYFSAGNVMECNIGIMPDGSVAVFDRTNVKKGQSAPNKFIVDSFVWLETKCIGNTGGANTGSVEVRIQGIPVLTVNGINLPNAFAFHGIGGFGAGNQSCWFDDWIVWNTIGPNAWENDFMGDRRLYLSFTNSNGALQDFTASTPPAWDCLNNAPPVDAGPYVDGAAAGNISEFGKSAIGVNSNDIACAVVIGRIFKTDAGTASGRIGINSNGNVVNSAEKFPGLTGAWFKLFQPTDPNGNIPWTRPNYDASEIRLTREQ